MKILLSMLFPHLLVRVILFKETIHDLLQVHHHCPLMQCRDLKHCEECYQSVQDNFQLSNQEERVYLSMDF